ncbi:MAG: LD-carboxypeptidase [Bacteroidota bacterium]|nr:LD-carboxypeptidase [Bacteroidota bacterium]
MLGKNYVKKGDYVSIIAPAGKISKEVVFSAKSVLESWGLNVILGKNLFKNHFKYSATDRQRLEDFQDALDSKEIKAIICARGGYGLIRIIDKIDFTKFYENPKWIVGFSDICILHSYVNNLFKIPTIHGPMCNGFLQEENKSSLKYLKSILFGKFPFYEIPTNKLNKIGKAKAVLIGGNLSIIDSLIGSKSDFDPKGKILFIEETGEYLYKIDRMMWGLKRSGKLKYLSGLIVGEFSETMEKANVFGKNAYEIISEIVENYDFPVCFDFPSGHGNINYPLIFGNKITLSVEEKSSFLNFD